MRKYDDRYLTPSQREKILQKYDYVCAYCFGIAEQIDHITPWSYIHNDSEDNLIACCWLCNIIAGDKVFEGFKEKRDFILKRRYNWIKANTIPLWVLSELKDLSYSLKNKIINTCVVFDNENERQKAKNILLREGYRVIAITNQSERRKK